MKAKFKIGDKVVVTEPNGWVDLGTVLTIKKENSYTEFMAYYFEETHLTLREKWLELESVYNQKKIMSIYQNTGNMIIDVDSDVRIGYVRSVDPYRHNPEGIYPGELCNRKTSEGILCPGTIERLLDFHQCCSCHTGNPPCSYCTSTVGCCECGWDSDEIEKPNINHFKFC